MKKVIHKAASRGYADHGWLKSFHTFSFAGYYKEDRVHFGMLRVLNDDVVAGGMGFGTHPHDNMEIVSIPLSGSLEHKDSTGRHKIIQTHDVQIMSAGSGIRHSEYNASATEPVNFLQIWVFPKERNIEPRYEQKSFDPAARQDRFQTVVAPNEPEAVWINQDAWFSLTNLSAGTSLRYLAKGKDTGLYIFVLSGTLEVEGELLSKRDALGLSEAAGFELKASEASEVLVIEVPMH